MASPQLENGFTRLNNELLEVVVRTPLAGRHLRLWLFVLRKTWGYGKKADYISLSQFVEGTGIDRSSVCIIIKDLVGRNLLGKKGSVYNVKKDYEHWVVGRAQISSGAGTTSSSGAGTTYKRNNIKETIQKKFINKKNMREYDENKHFEEPSIGDEDSAPSDKSATKGSKDFIRLFRDINPSWLQLWRRKPEHEAAKRLVKIHPFEWWVEFMPKYQQLVENDKFCPKAIKPSQMEDKIAAIELHIKSGLNNQKAKKAKII